MKSPASPPLRSAAALVLLLLTACASGGPDSAQARPVLYPNAVLNRVGDAQSQMEVNACISSAQAAGLRPSQATNEAGRRAGVGAATAGIASMVGALVTGRGSDSVVRAGATGAAVGGTAGAVSGALQNDRPSSVYRNFVQRCLSEKGFEVIGWN